jgi:hypothetical protein
MESIGARPNGEIFFVRGVWSCCRLEKIRTEITEFRGNFYGRLTISQLTALMFPRADKALTASLKRGCNRRDLFQPAE